MQRERSSGFLQKHGISKTITGKMSQEVSLTGFLEMHVSPIESREMKNVFESGVKGKLYGIFPFSSPRDVA